MQNTRADETIYWTETSCDREKEDGKFVRSQFVDTGVEQEERERERQRTLTSKWRVEFLGIPGRALLP